MKGSHLTIEMADHSARFVSFINEEVSNRCELIFDSQAEGVQKNQLRLLFENEAFLQGDFDEVTLSWSTKKSTLVPTNIFSESSPKSIFSLCYGEESEHPVDYNRIAELGIVNVFELPVRIKHFFVSKFPRVIIQHEGSHLLRKILRESKTKLKVSVILYNDYFHLIIDKSRDLKFYSFFDYQTNEDVIYHLMFAMQQKSLTNEEGLLEIIPGAGASQKMIEELIKNIGHIDDLKNLTIATPENFIAKSQLLCV